MFKKLAFTLAEVLITIGVIGVVAAITIPALITSYQKHVVETKLAKFNSTMNQALRLSMVDNDDPDSWVELGRDFTYEQNVTFLNTYLLPYMKYIRIEENPTRRNYVIIVLLDGSLFNFGISRDDGDMDYYPNGKIERGPRNSFAFQFTKTSGINNSNDIKNSNYIGPYIFKWNGDANQLKSGSSFSCYKGCKDCAYCTKLIQLNGWKIPKDYPW